MRTCPICETFLSDLATISGDFGKNPINNPTYTVNCPRCGIFNIDNDANSAWKIKVEQLENKERIRANASAWIFRNSGFHILKEDIDRLLNLMTPTFHERADIFLLELDKKTNFAGEPIAVDFELPYILAQMYCVNKYELESIIKYLENMRRIDVPEFGAINIEPNGWARLEEMRNINPNSRQGFVAMSFDESMKRIYDEGFSTAIKNAGYIPYRVDQSEHVEKIDDRIIAEIRKSKFIVADFTSHKAGVYFEAGFALGLGLPVIWSCKKDDMKNLHFDIRQYNCIDWENSHDLNARLRYRIESILGKGTAI